MYTFFLNQLEIGLAKFKILKLYISPRKFGNNALLAHSIYSTLLIYSVYNTPLIHFVYNALLAYSVYNALLAHFIYFAYFKQ